MMRGQLRDSLEEIEDKSRQLEKSWEQVKKSRDLLQTTIDSLNVDLIVLDRRLRITQANRNVRERYRNREITGRYCYEVTHGLNHPCRPPDYVCPASKVWQTGTPIRVIHTHSTNSSAGKTKYIEITMSPLYDTGGKITQVVELSRDITESKTQENRILEANRALRVLNDIAITVSQSLSLDFVLNSALEKALELMAGEIGGILLLDEMKGTLSYRAYRGFSEHFVRGTADIAIGEGIAGKVAEQGEPLVMDDIAKDPRVSRQLAVVEEGLKAFSAVPLKSKEKVVGVLTIASRKPRLFSEQEVRLLAALGHQLGVVIENAELYQKLQLKEQVHAELLRRIITAQEDERRRIARELHDVTSQALATLAVRVESLASVTGAAPADMEAHLKETRQLLTATSKEVHRLIFDLRPSLLDDLGLAAALRSCAHSLLDPAGIEVHLEVVGEENRLSPTVEIAVFRIVQEAVTNVASHSRAESAYISLEFKEKCIVAQVEDDGTGFEMPQIGTSEGARDRVGLLGMKERAELLGGKLTIDTEPGKGSRITTEIPIDLEQ
jgi:PAS domain S-box-containing protein